jgi:small conductance mechanosensitive channel
LTRVIDQVSHLRNVDATVARFLSSLVSVLLRVLLFISVASMLGVETTSFVTMIGAAGLAIGLALQGNLANVAGGLLILVFKPFRVGELIEAQGCTGWIKEIQLLHTHVRTVDNKLVVIPNGALSNGIITNFSREPRRAIEWTIAIDYSDDIALAKQTLARLAAADARVLQEPEPFIVVSALAESAVHLLMRVWVETENYWAVRYAMLEAVKLEFDAKGLRFPFPQTVVQLRAAPDGPAGAAKAET